MNFCVEKPLKAWFCLVKYSAEEWPDEVEIHFGPHKRVDSSPNSAIRALAVRPGWWRTKESADIRSAW